MKEKISLLRVGLVMALLGLTGCAINAVDVKTVTIPPQKEPVTVTVKGTATCQDYFLFYRVYENLEIKSSIEPSPKQ